MNDRKIWRRRRSNDRVSVRLSVRLHGPDAEIEGHTLDVSDTGTRLRLKLRDVGLDGDAGLFDLSRIVTRTFGVGCAGDFRHPRGTEWVRKEMSLVRIGLLRRQAGDFEIGCHFKEALTDDERRLLGFEAAAPGRVV